MNRLDMTCSCDFDIGSRINRCATFIEEQFDSQACGELEGGEPRRVQSEGYTGYALASSDVIIDVMNCSFSQLYFQNVGKEGERPIVRVYFIHSSL